MNRDVSVVIQCAAGKNANVGNFMSEDGRRILFVADPGRAPASASIVYRRPDAMASPGRSYRDMLVAYNRARRAENPFGLLPAWKPYRNDAYGRLAENFGTRKLFILPAGWGLLSADFRTPYYDVTFSNSARGENAYKRRSIRDSGYRDLCMSHTPPDAPGCMLRLYETTTRTNWHYECARKLIDGAIAI